MNQVRRNVLADMKKFATGIPPQSEVDWDLIWIFSGPGIDIAEDFRLPGGTILFDDQDGAALKDVARGINESQERLLTGFVIAKDVAAKRLSKRVGALTLGHLSVYAPNVYWNGTDWQNDNLRCRIREGFMAEHCFPEEKMIVSPDVGIQHTGDQFTKIEDWVIDGMRKIVLVSDTYHLPRIKRYLRKYRAKISPENTVLYPSQPLRVPVAKALSEIKKIPAYIERGILDPE